MTGFELVMFGNHLVLLLLAAVTAVLSWRLIRYGWRGERRTLAVACTVAGLTAIVPTIVAFTGELPVWHSLILLAAGGLIGWLTWRKRRELVAVLTPAGPAARAAVTPGTLLVMRGLPASGKSTVALRWRDEDPHRRALVSRDALRIMLHGGWKGAVTEPQVTAAEHAVIVALLRAGVDVVVDDTNLPDEHVHGLGMLALSAGGPIQIVDLRFVPLDQCLARNAVRTGTAHVNPVWIIRMHREHVAGRAVPSPEWASIVLSNGNGLHG